MSWFFYTLIGMFFQGTILFLVKLLSVEVHPLTILFYQYIGSLITMLAYLLIKKININLKRKDLIPVFFSGFLVSTGLSFYYLAIGLESASVIVPLHNVGITLIPVLLAFLFLKEKMNKRTILGIIFSITCIVLLTAPGIL